MQLGEHAFSVNIQSGEALFKLKKCTFDVPETVFKGTVHAEETISSDEDVTAKAVSLLDHPHGNVMNGPGQTSKPLPSGA